MKHFLRVLIFILAYGVSLYATRFYSFEVTGLLHAKGDLLQSLLYKVGFYTHVIMGPLALMSGAWQFLPSIRTRRPSIHRVIGYVYMIAILTSGLAALGIAPFVETGWVASLGFGSLAILWLYTTFQAYQAIRQHQITNHQQWMYRSYALTFAAVSLRLLLPLFLSVGLQFEVAYPIISWLCWIPNLILVEWIIRRGNITAVSI